jgi:hypothetical protein
LPDIRIKTPNLDDIFEKWKQKSARTDRKKMEKEFGTKGAVFSLDAVSGAEYVKDTMKEAAIYFAIKKTIGSVSNDKDETLVTAPRVGREQYYSFKGSGKISKEQWNGKDSVPVFESIQSVPCKNCRGKGFIENKCKTCKGLGKIEENFNVLVGEEQKKEKKLFSYPCGACYGSGNRTEPCKECAGHKNLYKYETLPVPFQTVVTGVPVLHSSAQTKYEKEIGEDLHKMIEDVEGIKFNNFKELESKSEASLGYINKNISKTIGAARSDHRKHEKDKDTQITTQIHLFPMIQMFCETKRGSKFEIYSLGSGNKFMTYSNF